jgi:hypothetical protein
MDQAVRRAQPAALEQGPIGRRVRDADRRGRGEGQVRGQVDMTASQIMNSA